MTVKPAAVRKLMIEYDLPNEPVAVFADTTGPTVSLWTRGLKNVSDEIAERIECAVSAMCSMCHYYDLPIRWSEVEKLRPIVKKYMQEHREYLAQQREERAAAKAVK